MAFTQIAGIAPNYRDYKNWWLKAYNPGTTTPKLMSDNDTGSPTSAKYEVNSDGFIISSGGTLIIPHIDGDYDLWLFPTAAEADANDTTNAERLADDLENYLTSSSIGNSIGGYVTYEFDTVANSKIGLTVGGQVVTLKENDVIRIKERANALFDVVAGTGTANEYEVIAHGSLDLSFVYRNQVPIDAVAIGVPNDGVTDATEAMQNAIDYTGKAGLTGELYLPEGDYLISSTLNMPRVAGGVFSEKGMQIIGASRGSTFIITTSDIAVFNLEDFCNFRHFTIEQRGVIGTGKAFFTPGQIRFCTFEDLNVVRFKFGCLFRYTLWLSWRDIYFVGCTCGVRLSRADDQEDQTNPSAPGSWNLIPGWFHNQLTFDNILCNAGEVGIWASCMGATFNNVTCQNQETDGTSNSVLPTVATIPFNSGSVEPTIGDIISDATTGATARLREIELTSGSWGGGDAAGNFLVDNDTGSWGSTNNINNDTTPSSNIATGNGVPIGVMGVGMWLEGGGDFTDSFNNTLINYYVEDNHNSLIVKETDSLVINGWFTQGLAGSHALLDITGSSVTIAGQTGQSPGFTYRVIGLNSKVCSHGELIAPSTVDSFTNTRYSSTGVFPNDTRTTTVTAVPETSGTITLDIAEDQIAYQRYGNTIHFGGRIDISSVSSPVGTYFSVQGLPFPAANLNERAGNAAISVTFFGAGGTQSLPAIIIENFSEFRVYIDASTLTATDSMYFSGVYFTD